MAQKDHWLNTRWWMLTVAEWIGLLLTLCVIISLFGDTLSSITLSTLLP